MSVCGGGSLLSVVNPYASKVYGTATMVMTVYIRTYKLNLLSYLN